MRILLIAASLLASGCSKSSGTGDDAVDRARFIAAGMDAISPKDLGDGMVLTGAKAEGAKITLSIKGVDPAELALPDFKQQAKGLICADRGLRGVIDKGVTVALDLKATSGSKRSISVENC